MLAIPSFEMRRSFLGPLLLFMMGCTDTGPRTPEHRATVASIDVPPPSPSAVASTPTPDPAPTPSVAPNEPGQPKAKTLREPVSLAPDKRCTAVLRRRPFGDFDKLAIEASTDCVEQILFDLDAEVAADTQHRVEHEGLMRYDMAPQGSPEGDGVSYQDVNFDGFVDIQMLRHQGTGAGDYNSVVACWLYVPKSRSFSRNAELERLPNPKLDPQKKIITWGGRLTGSLYINGHSGWIDGKLEILDQVETSSGTTPDGKPLPPGQRWERRKTRKGKGLTTVFNGPVAEF